MKKLVLAAALFAGMGFGFAKEVKGEKIEIIIKKKLKKETKKINECFDVGVSMGWQFNQSTLQHEYVVTMMCFVWSDCGSGTITDVFCN